VLWFAKVKLSTLVVLAVQLLWVSVAQAVLGDCGEPKVGGPVATDALEVLRTGVGASDCGGFDPCVCDVNATASVSASDALLVLQRAVGQSVPFACPCSPATSSTTTSSTTTTTLLQPPPTSELIVLTKRAASYVTSDLTGTWDVATLASGPDAPWWSRGAVTVQSDGTFAGNLAGSDGSNEVISGTLAISSLGIVTCVSGCQSGFQGGMDSQKRLVAATDTWIDGTTEILLFTKRAASYSLPDLAGTWELNSLTSDAGGGWNRGTLTIAADGSVAGSTTDSDGFSDVISGELALSPDGQITCVSGCPPNLEGGLDFAKTVGALTEKGDEGTTDLDVLSRKAASYAQDDLTGTWAVHSLASGYGAPWWTRGSLVAQADGTISGTLTNSEGGLSDVTGVLTVTVDGFVTLSDDDDLRCAIDSAKTIAICTDTW